MLHDGPRASERPHWTPRVKIGSVTRATSSGGVSAWPGPADGSVSSSLLRASDQWRYAIFAAFIIIMMAVRLQGIVGGGALRFKRQKEAGHD